MSASLALQRALYAALAGDPALAALVGGRIHDGPPRASPFPYLAFGEAEARDWSAGSEPAGADHRLALHAWSRAGGRSEAWSILERVGALLHGQDLTLAGHRLVILRVAGIAIRREPDGLTWRGTARLHGLTEPA